MGSRRRSGAGAVVTIREDPLSIFSLVKVRLQIG